MRERTSKRTLKRCVKQLGGEVRKVKWIGRRRTWIGWHAAARGNSLTGAGLLPRGLLWSNSESKQASRGWKITSWCGARTDAQNVIRGVCCGQL
jgi:hypothetical protein